jgi:hypothetical protein
MHISDVEKARMEKEHKMRNGYSDMSNQRFPHSDEITENRYVHKDEDNQHARERVPADYNMELSK